MKALDLYQSAVNRLKEADVPDVEIEASLLLGHLLDLSRTQIFLYEEELSACQIEKFETLLARRLSREPLAYIVEEQEFWSLPFKVNKNVLIPRPETELLLEIALQVMAGDAREFSGTILDMGSGSGVIAIILALELPKSHVVSLDISLDAQKVAQENAKFHRVSERVSFVNSDWLGGIQLTPQFDFVVTNPPYVARETFKNLQPEVVRFEPHLALDGGVRGEEEIISFVEDVAKVVKPGGRFFMEIGSDQAEFVMKLFGSFAEFDGLTIYDDYAGLPRIFHARRN